jgi:Flp pilus assembly protein TadG
MFAVVGSEKGVVMVIAALMLLSLLAVTALTVDVGQVYLTRSRLQKAADAAALAGSQSLAMTRDETEAESVAAQYIDWNAESPYGFSVEPDAGSGQVTVDMNKEVKFVFAPAIGYQKTSVGVSATAAAAAVIRVKNVVPFGVLQQEFEYGEQYVLKSGAGPGGGRYTGNFGALALGGNGACRYRENIKYGYQGQLSVGDQVTTEPGNMAGPTDDGISYRISLCTNGCSYSTHIEANCPRVVITPVIDALPNGRGRTTVVGFAAFFLEDTVAGESKGQKDVVGRFLNWAVTGDTGEDGTNFGVYSVRLVK